MSLIASRLCGLIFQCDFHSSRTPWLPLKTTLWLSVPSEMHSCVVVHALRAQPELHSESAAQAPAPTTYPLTFKNGAFLAKPFTESHALQRINMQ